MQFRIMDICVVLTYACAIVTVAIGVAYCGVYAATDGVPKAGDGLISRSSPMALETAIAFICVGSCLLSLSIRLLNPPSREDLIATNKRLAETISGLLHDKDK